jgi:hypothetical protein
MGSMMKRGGKNMSQGMCVHLRSMSLITCLPLPMERVLGHSSVLVCFHLKYNSHSKLKVDDFKVRERERERERERNMV